MDTHFFDHGLKLGAKADGIIKQRLDRVIERLTELFKQVIHPVMQRAEQAVGGTRLLLHHVVKLAAFLRHVAEGLV